MGLKIKALIVWLVVVAAVAGISAGPALAQKNIADNWPDMTWDEIKAEAKGQTVNWYMWGGSAKINSFVSGWVAKQAKKRYDITVNRVAIEGTVEAVNKVLGEKEAGVHTKGTVDMIWINGHFFKTMKQGDMLFCDYMHFMPNNKYIDWDDPTINTDFGTPVDKCETPWGRAQMVVVYDSARLSDPPKSLANFLKWVKLNPGRFTYPAPPDFTGMFFIKHVLYMVGGGYEPFVKPFDQKKWDEVSPKMWAVLNDIAPYLWREGKTYPSDRPAMHRLFANNEVDFTLATHPDSVGQDIEKGTFPQTTQSYVWEDGTVGDVHYVAVPYNSAHKAGALVLANMLISPEAQLEKAKPSVWGVRSALDLTRVPGEWQTKFKNLPRHKAVVGDAELARTAMPQPNSEWVKPMEDGWRKHVLKK